MEEHRLEIPSDPGLRDCVAARSFTHDVTSRSAWPLKPAQRSNQSYVVLSRNQTSHAAHTKLGMFGGRMGGVGGERSIDPVIDDRCIASGELILVTYSRTPSKQRPRHRSTAHFGARCVHNADPSSCFRHDGCLRRPECVPYRGGNSIVEYQSVVSVKNVGAIQSKPGNEILTRAREPVRLAKRVHRHTRGLGFRRQLTWMGSAQSEGDGLRPLLARQVNGETSILRDQGLVKLDDFH